MYSGIAPDITLPPNPADGPAPEGPEAETRAPFARKYEQVFREAGLGAYGDDPPAVAARVATSPVRDALLAALDDWAVSDVDLTRAKWVLTVARLADPDPCATAFGISTRWRMTPSSRNWPHKQTWIGNRHTCCCS